jgi:hypothetical protein
VHERGPYLTKLTSVDEKSGVARALFGVLAESALMNEAKEPGTLLSEVSPHGYCAAVLEQDDAVAYLYIRGVNAPGGMRTCWVRNLAPAPEGIDRERMTRGLPPMLPQQCCAHPGGAPPLSPGKLRLEWFEEGTGVALFDEDALLAAIPPWALDPSTSSEVVLSVGRYLMGQTAFPWSRDTWLGDGHSLGFVDVIPPGPSKTTFKSALLLERPGGAPVIEIPAYADDPVNVLWVMPITEGELNRAKRFDGRYLNKQLVAQGVSWIFRDRAETNDVVA